MSVDRKTLLARLRAFGLDQGEAVVYYELCRVGSARAAEIAKAADRKRPDTYRLLDALVRKGFAEKTLERPTRYLAIDAATALERITEARQSELEALAEESQALAELWPQPHATAGPTSQRFTVYQGRDQVHGLMSRMFEAAADEVTIVAAPGGLAHLGLGSFLKSIEGKAGSSVRTRLLTKPESHRHEVLQDLEAVAEIRYAELPSFHQMVIVDATQIALFVSGGRKLSTQGEEETVLWLNSPDFVLAQKALFDEVWKTAVLHAERSAAEEEGRLPTEMHILRGRWQRLDRIRRMASRAQGRIEIVAPATDLARWQRAGLVRALQQRIAKGIDVWIWSDGDVPEGAEGVRLPAAPSHVDVMVDGREALTVMGAHEAPDAIAHDGEWAVWGTHYDHVSRVAQQIKRLPEIEPLVKID